MKKIFTIQTILILIILMLPSLVHASSGPDTTPGDPDSAPIDGGLSLLIAGGVGYGVKKLREKRRRQQEEVER
jgi:hypothetical protein